MSVKAFHHVNGSIGLKVEDTDPHVVLEVDPGSRSKLPGGVPVPSPTPSPAGGRDPEFTEIHMGPLPPPPLPLGIVISRDIGRPDSSGKRALQVHLGTAFEDGQFSDSVMDAVGRSAKGVPEGTALDIEAYLPPEHSIDLTLLSGHVIQLGESVGRKISLRVGAKIVKD
jgi:hypothetical protein